jgi:two-component system sensor histidine kinase RstB
MFLRIYVSLLVSSALAAALCYGLYQWQYQYRLHQHYHQVFNGSMHMIARGLVRHEGDRRERWKQVVEKLIGAEINVRQSDQIQLETPEVEIEHLEAEVGLLTYDDGLLAFTIEVEEITEQHYRLMAILLNNELGRVPERQRQDLINELNPYFVSNIYLRQLDTIELDRQQLSRLKRFDVVVSGTQLSSDFTRVYSRLPKSRQVIEIGPISSFSATTASVLGGMLLLSIMITGAVAYILVKRLEQRLSSIEKEVSNFAMDPVHIDLNDRQQDAIGHLATSVNGMSQRIHQVVSDQKQMLQAISHELRTPISRLKFRLETLSEDQLSDRGKQSIKGIRSDINEMDDLITEAVSFNKGTSQPFSQKLNIVSVINELIEKLKVEYSDIRIELVAPSELTVVQDKNLLRRTLLNLIQNACKYGDGQVRITLRELAQHVSVLVEDNGQGIPQEKRQSVFSPFTRIETSRNKRTGGIGLGLAVVKNICEVLNFRILISDSALGGVCFDLTVPKKGETHV